MRCRRPLISTSVVVLAASLLAAGCGGGSSTTAATTQNGLVALVAYAHCMRSHGVPHFPDPTSGQGIAKGKIPVGTPQFRVASSACSHLMPANGLGPPETPQQNRVADALAFARCMRSRGFASFPDPTNQGQLTPQMVTAAGIDLHQPELLRAGLACVPVTHGLLTRAAIERAVNGG
jgi:hypothetical protein